MPQDVRADPVFGGREHFHQSLGTKDLNQAKGEALRLNIWFEEQVARVRGEPVPFSPKRSVTGPALTEDELDALAARIWKVGIDADEKDRLYAQQDPSGDHAELLAARDDEDHYLVASFNDPETGTHNRRRHRDRLIKGDLAVFIEHECRKRGIAVGSLDYLRIANRLADGEIELMKARYQRQASASFEVEPPLSIRRGLNTQGTKLEASWTLRKLAEHVLEHRPKGASWAHKVTTTVSLFEDYLGSPTPISQITRDHVRDFLELLRKTPTNAAQRYPGRSIKECAALNSQRDRPFPTIQPNTIRDSHHAVLRRLFGFAHMDLQAIDNDPTARLKIDGTTRRGGRRAAFTLDELEALFQLPLFTGCASEIRVREPGDFLINDHRFWTPLIMLFSGARPSELAQLAVTDIKLDAQVPHIRILTEFDPRDPADKEFVLTCKTENARRDIPIHRVLFDLGFGEFVCRARASGHVRLFPEWKTPADSRKLYSSDTWVRAFNEKLVPTITQRKPKPTIYSLRHTCKKAMVECGVAPQVQNQLLGHAKMGMDVHYFEGASLHVLATEMDKLLYPGLDLKHLART